MKVARANIAQNLEQNFDGSDWLSAVEAASYLRIFSKDGSPCVARIRNLVNLGRIPFYKPYGRLLFRKSELERLVESSRKGGFKCR
ncbi:MAG: helix-turn-helix domain-containing protein [Bdellovibrionaceae bacterium]|nr:helix-turn-helix domain-containing protein [Pseudobdellovibrionaceae bacterium]